MSEPLFEAAQHQIRNGQFADAVATLWRLLDQEPAHFDGLRLLGHLLELQGHPDEAVLVYQAAMAINPGHAEPWTRRAVLLLRKQFGPIPTPRPAPQGDRLTMTTLGMNGRFANQLMQYAHVRLYAEEFGIGIEVPEWPGRFLFDFDDALPSGRRLPQITEPGTEFIQSMNREVATSFANCNLWGYFEYPTSGLRPFRDRFRALYRPGRRVADAVATFLSQLRQRGETVVAIHLRRTDVSEGDRGIGPESGYQQWLERIWPTLDRPVLYIASDDPEPVVGQFAAYHPVTMTDLATPIPGAEFYLDFCALSHAHRLAIAHSTFSFTAAMLNEVATEFVRPCFPENRLVPFDPWNAEIRLTNSLSTLV